MLRAVVFKTLCFFNMKAFCVTSAVTINTDISEVQSRPHLPLTIMRTGQYISPSI